LGRIATGDVENKPSKAPTAPSADGWNDVKQLESEQKRAGARDSGCVEPNADKVDDR
jgi:hypothetical protein